MQACHCLCEALPQPHPTPCRCWPLPLPLPSPSHAQVLEKDTYGRTLLHLCCEGGTLAYYDAIISYVADYVGEESYLAIFLDQEDLNRESALSVAAIRGHVKLVSALLQAGVRVSKSCYEAILMIQVWPVAPCAQWVTVLLALM